MIASLFIMVIATDAQVISLDMNISNDQLNPVPTSVRFILSGKDSTYSQTFGISDNHFQCNLEPINSGHYGMHVQLLESQEIILEGFGRGQVSLSDTTFIKSYVSIISDTLYLMVDWVRRSGLKSQSFFNNNMDLDTSNLKLYPIHNPDSIADVWLSKGMPYYNQYDVNYSILDSNLVPIINYSFGAHRNPVSTTQVAFAFYEDLLRTHDPKYEEGFLNNVNWLVENHDSSFYLHYDFQYNHGGRTLKRGWVSAMAQGLALGAISMAYSYTGDSIYLNSANGLFKTLYSNTEDHWCVVVDENQYYWLEEYPNEDICHVLNGKIAGLFGLWEYYVITRDPFALKLMKAGIRTLVDHTSLWNIPNQHASYYCLHHSSYPNYHILHVYQLNFLGSLLGVQELIDAAGLFSNHTFCVYPATSLLSNDQGLTQFTVFNSNDWEASINSDWLGIDTIMSNTMKVRYDRNLTLQEKSGRILVTDVGPSNSLVLLITQQKGESFFFSVPDTIRVTNDSGTFEVKIYSNLSWEGQPDSSWLSATKVNDSTLMISFLENPEHQERSSEIIISTHLNDTFKIHIIQQGIQVSARSTLTDHGINIYPNPAQNRLIISSKNRLTGSLEIYSITGEKVMAMPWSSRYLNSIDVSMLPASIYLVKAQTRQSSIVQRLIIH